MCSAKIVSWMNKKFMDDVPSKLPQLFNLDGVMWAWWGKVWLGGAG
jgi:hypothetical protein